jgi:hypothetical protein
MLTGISSLSPPFFSLFYQITRNYFGVFSDNLIFFSPRPRRCINVGTDRKKPLLARMLFLAGQQLASFEPTA